MKEKTNEDKIKGNTFERKEKGDENSMGNVKKGTSDRSGIVAGKYSDLLMLLKMIKDVFRV